MSYQAVPQDPPSNNNPHNDGNDNHVNEEPSWYSSLISNKKYLSILIIAVLVTVFALVLTMGSHHNNASNTNNISQSSEETNNNQQHNQKYSSENNNKPIHKPNTNNNNHNANSNSNNDNKSSNKDKPSNKSAPSKLKATNLTEATNNISSTIIEKSADDTGGDSLLLGKSCDAPYPGYPFCEDHVNDLLEQWKTRTPQSEAGLRAKGIDGTKCSMLTYLNLNGFYCPEAADYSKEKIRGVNLGGWLVLEPWITPSLFEPFLSQSNTVMDQWTWCAALGKDECLKRLEKHWSSWLVENDIKFLSENGINHVRIPVGYWIMGDIRPGEPWVLGDLKYLERGIAWCAKYGIHVVLDLHCAPGSQNGFDNSGRKGEIHFSDGQKLPNGRVIYPNINRALQVIEAITQHFSQAQFVGTVVGVELANEIFITVPIEIVKDFYVQGYEIVKKYGDLAVIIGDSFRWGASEWGNFLFPPHYRHVWIDTHIYQVFDMYRLGFTWEQHMEQTCKVNLPQVAVAPLSTMVGEWSLATTDCAKWLNGFGIGSRFDGSFPGSYQLGNCTGEEDYRSFSPEYKQFLLEFADKQMDAYESGSSEGWFFWNFKTERSPQWNYMLGVQQGWIPKDHKNRRFKCS